MFDRAEYNGIKLLPLPETLDVSEFPYLIFAKRDNNIITLYAFTEKVYMTADHFLTAGAEGTLRRFTLENDSYEQHADWHYLGSEKIFTSKFSGIFWSNWDVQYPMDGIYFYGSIPIPTTRWISHRFDADFVKKENRVIVNAAQNDNSSRTFIISLLENGEKWMVAFTSFEEQMKGNTQVMSTFMAKIDQLFDMALAEKSVKGLLLNPWNRTIMLDKELLGLIKGGKQNV